MSFNDSMNKISIITVNRNNAEGLEKTIRSVVKQTYFDYEFIVIDGASTDASVDVIKKYSEYISYWVSEKDNGIFNAMNKGIKVSSGDYCYFLNSADALVSADTLANIFQHKKYVVPFINGNQINDYGTTTGKVPALHRPLTLFDFYKGTIKHQATFIRRDLFDKYGLYDENLKIISDWKFFLQVIGLHNEQPVFVDEDIAIFEWYGMSTNIELIKKHQEERLKVFDECIPTSILNDYKRLDELNDSAYLVDAIQKSRMLGYIVKGFYKMFKIFGVLS